MRNRTFDRQRRILLAAACAAVAAAGLSRPGRGDEPVSGPGGAAARPPNILLIFVDDLGYADVGAFGCRDIPTPNIDGLAREGVRFTNAYCTGAWCVPSRAGLLTGFFAGRPAPRRIEPIGRHLTAAGYATMEMGKLWHGRAACSEYLEVLNNTNGRYMPPNPVRRTGAKEDVLQEYVTDAIARESVEFIDRNKDRPFFLYLPTTAVHTPLQAPRKYLDRFADLKPPRQIYAACLSAVDDAVGAIVAKLRAEKIDHNTLILFASDNGGIGGPNGSNLPLRGFKFTPYEGGIRTPFIARWPARLPAGAVYDGTVSMVDILPTAVAAATGKQPEAADGVDLVPFLTGKRQGSPHETLVWWGVKTGKDGSWVVRHGRWKLIGKGEEPAELYDLAEDLAETNNRIAQHPEIAQDLVARLMAWRQAGDERAAKDAGKK